MWSLTQVAAIQIKVTQTKPIQSMITIITSV